MTIHNYFFGKNYRLIYPEKSIIFSNKEQSEKRGVKSVFSGLELPALTRLSLKIDARKERYNTNRPEIRQNLKLMKMPET